MKEISIVFTRHEFGRKNNIDFTPGFKSLTFGVYDLKVRPWSLAVLVNAPKHALFKLVCI